MLRQYCASNVHLWHCCCSSGNYRPPFSWRLTPRHFGTKLTVSRHRANFGPLGSGLRFGEIWKHDISVVSQQVSDQCRLLFKWRHVTRGGASGHSCYDLQKFTVLTPSSFPAFREGWQFHVHPRTGVWCQVYFSWNQTLHKVLDRKQSVNEDGRTQFQSATKTLLSRKKQIDTFLIGEFWWRH